MIVESLIVHVVGDFYLQKQPKDLYHNRTRLEVENQIRNYGWSSVVVFLISIWMNPNRDFIQPIFLLLAIPVLNFLHKKFIVPSIIKGINTITKSQANIAEFFTKNGKLMIFIISQIIHTVSILLIINMSINLEEILKITLTGVLTILTLIYLYKSRKEYNLKQAGLFIVGSLIITASILYILYNFTISLRYEIFYQQIISYTLVILILMRPANLLIRKLSSNYDPKSDLDYLGRFTDKSSPKPAAGFQGAGAMIGNLERIMILLSFVSGNLIPIVAILSIKAFARYKLIVEDASFSEYFVIGTMLSVVITFVLYLMLHALLGFN